MDLSLSSAASARLKRKCDCSDSISQLLHDFSLTPRTAKKLHQDFGSTSLSTGVCSTPYLPKQTADCGSLTSDIEFSEELPNEPEEEELINETDGFVTEIGRSQQPVSCTETNDQKAIVLYKPVNLPLFPGGPIAGSQILLNASFLPSGVVDSSCPFAGRKDDRWLQSVKTVEMTDPMEDSEDGNSQFDSGKRSLAVIPWVHNPPKYVECQAAEFPLRAGEDMEEDSMAVIENPVNNLNSSYRFEPWQQHGVPWSHYSSAMWSH